VILYYAMGGGLGHLTRAVAFLHTLSLSEGSAVITSSSFADDPRVVGGIRTIHPPATLEDDAYAFGAWIRRTIAAEQPERLVVDSFPAGLLGELSGLTTNGRYELWHVARLLKWQNYAKRVGNAGLPEYDVVWETEPLHADHENALRPVTRDLRHLQLTDPPPAIGAPNIEGRHWLVVHSGPPDEVEELLRYAIEMRERESSAVRIVLVSVVRPPISAPSLTMIDVFPAWPLFERAERIITAAGFNVMRQTESYRDRHRFVPFPRALDDQYTRAARARLRATNRQD